jgi:hypothetical protein
MAKVIVCMKQESYSDMYRYPITVDDIDVSSSDRVVQDNFSWEDTLAVCVLHRFQEIHDIDESPYSIHMIHVETGKQIDLSDRF